MVRHASDRLSYNLGNFVCEAVKKIIEKIMFKYSVIRPQKVLNYLRTKLKKYEQLVIECIEANVEPPQRDIDRMPQLDQIQNFVKHRRKRIGHLNSVDDVINYARLHSLDQVKTDKDLFIFGSSFGTGADDSHFRLGIFVK